MNSAMPKGVASAIVGIQGDLEKIPTDAVNTFNNYAYASIDKYYETIRPLLSKWGLVIVPVEQDAGLSPDGKTYKVTFAFYLCTSSGETWDVPITRTVYMSYGGAQSMGAALSYAEKFMFRTLFKIDTGEEQAEVETAPVPLPVANHDADALPKAKQGQDTEIDYEYSGPPYRIFNKDQSVKQTFSASTPWGTALKAMVKTDKSAYENNQKEIERVRKEVEIDKSLTDVKRNNIIKALDSLKGEADA